MAEVIELMVSTKNPKALDGIAQTLGAVVEEYQGQAGFYVPDENGNYAVRCYGSADYVAFVIEAQGYGKVIERRTVCR